MQRARAVIALALAAGLCAPAPARAADASPWAATNGAAARLVAGGAVSGSPDLLAGVEIRLDPGTITYWRDPGEAGVAPRFETGASANVAGVTVGYPAPRRLDEAGSEAFGYAGHVVFPLRVRRTDAARPATLALDLRYAVCAAQCLPAKARLRLDLTGRPPAPAVAALVDAAVAAVPRRATLGDPGAPAIDAVAATADDAFAVRARAGGAAALFVEGPPGWYFGVKPGGPAGPGAVAVPVTVLQRPAGAALAGLRVTLTLVDGDRSVEVEAPVDSAAPAR